jgi:hypothetical protein
VLINANEQAEQLTKANKGNEGSIFHAEVQLLGGWSLKIFFAFFVPLRGCLQVLQGVSVFPNHTLRLQGESNCQHAARPA